MKNIIYISIVARRKEGKPGKWAKASENKENGQDSSYNNNTTSLGV